MLSPPPPPEPSFEDFQDDLERRSSSLGDIPHLPLIKNWRDGDFSLRSVIGSSLDGVNIRDWSLKLLQRYRFVIGTIHFMGLMAFMFLSYGTIHR